MRILVCVKQVPDPEAKLKVSRSGLGLDEQGVAFVLNEYDRFAMEEAVRIKECFEDVHITVLSVGPARVIASIKKALELGGQTGVHIDDTELQGATGTPLDALGIASLLASWVGDKGFDIILCGIISQDEQRGQVGPMLAELLGWPCATSVISEKISPDMRVIEVERELERGFREIISLPLPALLTIQSGINVPRYGSLSNVLRVKKMEIPTIAAQTLGPARACEKQIGTYLPGRSSRCEFLKGSESEIAEKLIDIFKSKARVRR